MARATPACRATFNACHYLQCVLRFARPICISDGRHPSNRLHACMGPPDRRGKRKRLGSLTGADLLLCCCKRGHCFVVQDLYQLCSTFLLNMRWWHFQVGCRLSVKPGWFCTWLPTCHPLSLDSSLPSLSSPLPCLLGGLLTTFLPPPSACLPLPPTIPPHPTPSRCTFYSPITFLPYYAASCVAGTCSILSAWQLKTPTCLNAKRQFNETILTWSETDRTGQAPGSHAAPGLVFSSAAGSHGLEQTGQDWFGPCPGWHGWKHLFTTPTAPHPHPTLSLLLSPSLPPPHLIFCPTYSCLSLLPPILTPHLLSLPPELPLIPNIWTGKTGRRRRKVDWVPGILCARLCAFLPPKGMLCTEAGHCVPRL